MLPGFEVVYKLRFCILRILVLYDFLTPEVLSDQNLRFLILSPLNSNYCYEKVLKLK